jgi:hypothetical protein
MRARPQVPRLLFAWSRREAPRAGPFRGLASPKIDRNRHRQVMTSLLRSPTLPLCAEHL